jgi:hypothetical protein
VCIGALQAVRGFRTSVKELLRAAGLATCGKIELQNAKTKKYETKYNIKANYIFCYVVQRSSKRHN